ncbi:acylneuraminate cytidylyltransferase family protein [Donghicola sp. C2-DW-16]|uniref:Acylneuraminate cytidylyltransferase family protein n=1 Tax=Donghicola mangrovi TaxID=2729614 RepID=A0ABX2PDA6_9RHOB|nr:acylneuraminate cytidylyltransferase family protein [Donghicola mangrovi]NVO26946.1 acylneuraminate cytidylyltransferase family protein [Donghicola mangrovi]
MRVAIICARGGSKGVPRKNVRDIAGKPLIAWSVEQALDSGVFQDVIVSSDDPEILDVAGKAGATFLVERPAEFATDSASVLPAIEHGLAQWEEAKKQQVTTFVLLQPTSPTRATNDIVGAIELFETAGVGSVVTGSLAKASPYFSMLEEQPDGSVAVSKRVDPPYVRRQDAPKCYEMNGSIYVIDRVRFSSDQRSLYPDTRIYEMSEEASVDIDTELDFKLAELILRDR